MNFAEQVGRWLGYILLILVGIVAILMLGLFIVILVQAISSFLS